MSVQLEVYLVNTLSFELSSAKKIVKNILDNGWVITHEEKIVCFPAASIDERDWLEKRVSVNDFLKTIKKAKEEIVVNLFWKETDIGISVQIYPLCELSAQLCSITRLKFDLQCKVDIVDVTWYLKMILPCFHTDKSVVGRFVFSQVL